MLDLENTFDEMASVFGENIGEDVNNAANLAKSVFLNNKETLEELHKLLQDGDITQEEFAEELKDQQAAFEAEMQVSILAGKMVIQRAMDSAMNVLKQSVLP